MPAWLPVTIDVHTVAGAKAVLHLAAASNPTGGSRLRRAGTPGFNFRATPPCRSR
jgi:hypothetical protein